MHAVYFVLAALAHVVLSQTDCSVRELIVGPTSPIRVAVGPYTYDDDGPTGPSNWASIDCPGYATCGTGRRQSPFNIDTSTAALARCRVSLDIRESTGAAMRYMPVPGDFMLDCLDDGSCGEMTYRGVTYSFLQMHLHADSEYRLDGFKTDMEMHLVHQSEDGRFAVLGMFITEGARNPAFDAVLETARLRSSNNSVNVRAIIGDVATRPQPCTFMGSLTTPPCTEGIQWILSMNTIQLSRKQIDTYLEYTGNKNNNRPLQKANRRPIVCYFEENYRYFDDQICTQQELRALESRSVMLQKMYS